MRHSKEGSGSVGIVVAHLGQVARVWLSRDRFVSWEMGIAQLAKGDGSVGEGCGLMRMWVRADRCDSVGEGCGSVGRNVAL